MSSAEIRPFTITVTDQEIDDLRRRLAATRWPDPETVTDWTQGIPLAYVQDLCAYWRDDYDWRRCETRLNGHANFLTDIDGLDIHFQHIRSPHDGALPLLMTHGWPGSIVEFQEVIGPLTDPPAHGGAVGDAFDLVLPSLPGYGWSGRPDEPGWGVERIAAAWHELMSRLGYSSWVAQGGDWGSAVTTRIGTQDLGGCRAIHLNFLFAGPDPETLDDLTELEQAAMTAFEYYDRWDSAYAKQNTTRPQTVGYGLVDSPAGLAAWIVEKFWAWTDRDGLPHEHFSIDDLLDNVSVYWFTATAASAARLYWESFTAIAAGQVELPTGCSVFPNEIIKASKRWAARRYPNITYWSEPDAGGHFAAFERPELFVSELRSFFGAHRGEDSQPSR